MGRLGLETAIVDETVAARTAASFGKAGIRLPTFAELADPTRIRGETASAVGGVDPDAAHPLNLFRVHWYNATDRKGLAASPGTLVLPKSLTGATDDATLYASEGDKARAKYFSDAFDETAAAETWGRDLAAVTTDHLIELDSRGRDRIFNLGYYTWVEQQGIPLPEFEARRSQAFWRGLRDLVPAWDALIEAFNARAEKA